MQKMEQLLHLQLILSANVCVLRKSAQLPGEEHMLYHCHDICDCVISGHVKNHGVLLVNLDCVRPMFIRNRNRVRKQ